MRKNAVFAVLASMSATLAQTATYTSETITNGSTAATGALQLGSKTATGSKIWSNTAMLGIENPTAYGFRINGDAINLVGSTGLNTRITGEGPITLSRSDAAVVRSETLKHDTLWQSYTDGPNSYSTRLKSGQLTLGYSSASGAAAVSGGLAAIGASLQLYTSGSCCGQYASPDYIVVGNYQGTTFNTWLTIGGGKTANSANVTVAGDARVNGKLFIGTTGWSVSAPDYVFGKDYKLASLSEVESYVSENHHLPGIESAGAMEEKGGVDLVQMNLDLLKKVEELTLYMIEQNKKIESLQARVGSRN